jgi:hypothetical protein
MIPKLGGLLVLMTAMLGGCATWTRMPAHEVDYDYSDRAFYDHPYAPSPAYAANFVQNARIVSGVADEQTAPTLAKTAPEAKAEGASVDPPAEIPAAPPVEQPPAKSASQGVVLPQTTSSGPTRSGQSSSSADR